MKIAASAVLATVVAGGAHATLELSAAMPPKSQCSKSDCAQAALVTDALASTASNAIAYAHSGSFVAKKAAGWPDAGPLDDSTAEMMKIFGYKNTVCTMSMGGGVLRQVINGGLREAGALVHVSHNVKVTFSKAVDGADRIEVDVGSGWVALDDSATYTVVAPSYDAQRRTGYDALTASLATEEKCTGGVAATVLEYVKALPDAVTPITATNQRLVQGVGVELCKSMFEPHQFKGGKCVKCAAGKIAAANGLSCVNPSVIDAAMPAKSLCKAGDCAQGVLVTDALRATVGPPTALAIAYSSSFGDGWKTAGPVEDATGVYGASGKTVCTMKLRGATLLRVMERSAQHFGRYDMLHAAGLRLTLNKDLPEEHRLVSLEVTDGAGGFAAVDRAALYTIAIPSSDVQRRQFKNWTHEVKRTGESSECPGTLAVHQAITSYLQDNTPYAPVVATGQRIVESTAPAMIVDFNEDHCAKSGKAYDVATDSCVKCPPGESCETKAPVPTDAPAVTEVPATASPVMVQLTKDMPAKDLCKVGDCAQGRLVTRALVAAANATADTPVIAFLYSGSLTHSKVTEWTAGPVATDDATLKHLYYYDNGLCRMKLLGSTLLKVLALGVSDVGSATLQLAGVRVKYSDAKPEAERLLSAEAAGADGTWAAVDPAALYTVVAPQYDVQGRAGYREIAEQDTEVRACTSSKDADDLYATLRAYLLAVGTVTPAETAGIFITNATEGGDATWAEVPEDEKQDPVTIPKPTETTAGADATHSKMPGGKDGSLPDAGANLFDSAARHLAPVMVVVVGAFALLL